MKLVTTYYKWRNRVFRTQTKIENQNIGYAEFYENGKWEENGGMSYRFFLADDILDYVELTKEEAERQLGIK